MRNRVFGAWVAIVSCVSASVAVAQPATTWPLASDHFAVGFTVSLVADSARAMPTAQPRPVQLAVWYPARRPGAGRAMTYADYVLHTASELGIDSVAARKVRDDAVAGYVSARVSDVVVRSWFDAPMRAVPSARPAGGRFPLVLIAQGNGQSAHDQAALAEFLASNGYVVASTPSPMRITGPMKSQDEVGARSEEQADDLELARRTLASRGDVDARRTVVIGHSFGARAALLLAMRAPDAGAAPLRAVVSLDGGIGTATARANFESAPSFRAASEVAPILHIYEELDAYMAPDFGLLRSLTASERWLLRAPDLHHHHFTALGAASGAYPALGKATGAADGTAEAYTAVARATLLFLDAYVKDVAKARRLISLGRWPAPLRAERLPPSP